MRLVRRVGGAAGAALLLGTFVGGGAATAQSDVPETFVGSAAGKALHLRLGGEELTMGSSNAKVTSALEAAAGAKGAIGVPLLEGANVEDAVQKGVGTVTNEQACATPALLTTVTNAVDILDVDAACSSALASVTETGMQAVGNGTVATVGLTNHTLVAGTVEDVAAIVTTITQNETLQGALDTIAATTGVDLAVDDTVDLLLDTLSIAEQPLLAVELGDSTSSVVSDATSVTSTAVSKGGVISILPGAVLGEPVAEIEIASASASASYDRATGKSGTPTYQPAIVTVRINTPTTDELGKIIGVDLSEIVIGPQLNLPALGNLAAPCSDAANEYCLFEGQPLETRIAVASGRTYTTADGGVGAAADAVKIHALKNITDLPTVGTQLAALDGGLLLEIASADALVAGAPAVIAPPQPATPIETPRELPRTGGTPWVALAGVGALTAALFGRRVLARSN